MQNWAHWNPELVEMDLFAERARFAMLFCDALMKHDIRGPFLHGQWYEAIEVHARD